MSSFSCICRLPNFFPGCPAFPELPENLQGVVCPAGPFFPEVIENPESTILLLGDGDDSVIVLGSPVRADVRTSGWVDAYKHAT